jgi:hypothetical protein
MSNLKQSADTLNDIVNKSLKSIEKNVNIEEKKLSEDTQIDKIGVLVMACNRPSVSYHLDQLLK